jgi:hypothetical protein
MYETNMCPQRYDIIIVITRVLEISSFNVVIAAGVIME